MKRWTVGMVGDYQIILMDSISYIGAEDVGQIVISGSHGGLAAAQYALEHPPLLVVFNDAGVGKDQAGIMALETLGGAGIAAVAVAHTSARIGEAAETWEHGIVSHMNQLAEELGVTDGQLVSDLIQRELTIL